MQKACRVLLQELKTDQPNLDLALQTVRDIFAVSTNTLDQIGRTDAFNHQIHEAGKCKKCSKANWFTSLN